MRELKNQLLTILDTIPEEKLKDVLALLQPRDKKQEASNFLFNVCQGITLKMTGEKEITYYNKDNEWLFQQNYKNGKLWISYYRVWELLKPILGDNYNEIRDFIQGWVETNLNWQGLTPVVSLYRWNVLMETNLNWQGLTPMTEH
jgi:hypothetical protein